MTRLLYIDTATTVCSVALSEDGEVRAIKEVFDERSHAAQLGHLIELLLQEEKLSAGDLAGVVVSQGPGSYTGLRIGISTAKGLCYGAHIPLIAVPTLKQLAQGLLLDQEVNNNALLCPMIDARRMEVYTAVYDATLSVIQDVSAMVIDENAFQSLLEKQPVIFFGSGADKCRKIIRHPNARFIKKFKSSARYMIPLAMKKWAREKFEDTAYFEPFYLKDFIATKPKKNILQ